MEKINFNVPGGHKKLLKYTICLLPAQIQKKISSPAKPDTLSCYQLQTFSWGFLFRGRLLVKPTALILKTEQRYGRERHVRDRRGPGPRLPSVDQAWSLSACSHEASVRTSSSPRGLGGFQSKEKLLHATHCVAYLCVVGYRNQMTF